MSEDTIRKDGWNAFLAAQSEFAELKLDSVNPHFKSRYASLGEVLRTVRPVLNKHGLVLATECRIQGDMQISGSKILYSGETIVQDEWVLGKITATQQQLGSANTYARRYSIQNLCGLVADDDDDGERATPAKKDSEVW